MRIVPPRLVMAGIFILGVSSSPVHAQPAPNAVTDWAAIIQQGITGPAAPRSAGTSEILHTMAMLAVYDAVVAIEGGYQPYAAAIQAPAGADIRAAVATAAYLTTRARAAGALVQALDDAYLAYLAGIADGQAKIDGVAVGQQASEAILAVRAGDGYDTVVPYWCSSTPLPPGEFEPDAGCPDSPGPPQPVDVKLGQIAPFTFADPARFRTAGPNGTTSAEYAADFVETARVGRIDSAFRSAEQTDIAYFWSENPYVHWNRNLIGLALARGLDIPDAARFFAMVHTSVSDSIIAGFEAKYHYRFWRPRTAIALADLDGNPGTVADPAWTPLLKVNHPEYPSGHGFWSGALVDAVEAFFGTKHITWTIVTSKAAVPAVVKTERTYDHLNKLVKQIGDSRVWAGLHWRHSVRQGDQIGRGIARHVAGNFFLPLR